jgi:hypothetical protein
MEGKGSVKQTLLSLLLVGEARLLAKFSRSEKTMVAVGFIPRAGPRQPGASRSDA